MKKGLFFSLAFAFFCVAFVFSQAGPQEAKKLITIDEALNTIESEVLSWQEYWLKQEKRLYTLELLVTESSSYQKA